MPEGWSEAVANSADFFRCSMGSRQAGGVLVTLLAGVAITEMLRLLRRHRTGRKKMRPDMLPHPADHAQLTKTLSEVQTLLSDIEVGPNIGAGTFGKVYKGQLKRSARKRRFLYCSGNLYCSFSASSKCRQATWR